MTNIDADPEGSPDEAPWASPDAADQRDLPDRPATDEPDDWAGEADRGDDTADRTVDDTTDDGDDADIDVVVHRPEWQERWRDPERWVNVAVLAVCTYVMLRTFYVFGYLTDDTTPNGGDMGAHVWAPAYLRDHLLPNWRLFGWSPDWYAGMPTYHFYMVLPPLAIVIFDVLLPYGIAFKLVSVAGVVTMPLSAFAFGKLARLRFPAPAFLAIGALPFLFDTGFAILGGNITSTLAGEFNFSIALSGSLLFLGLLVRALQDDHGWVRAAVVGAVVLMCHVLVGMFALAAAVSLIGWHSWGRWRLAGRAGLAAGLAGLLTAWWSLPFWVNRHLTFDMGWTKEKNYWEFAIPHRMLWAFALAVAAVAAGARRRDKVVLSMATWCVILGIAFRLTPEHGRLWNTRLMPGLWLTVYLLAGLGALELLRGLVRIWRFDWTPRQRQAAPLATLAVAFVFVSLPMKGVPGVDEARWAQGRANWLGLDMRKSLNYEWIRYNYRGYEEQDNWPEYSGIMDTMNAVGAEHGCGRAHYEYDASQEKYGTTLAMMLLPYWTEGCIGSMEGLYFESSSTTPFHFLMASELSANPSRPVTFPDPGVWRYLTTGDPPTLDQSVFDHGIEHLQLYGVKYYMAYTQFGIEAAEARPDVLTEVARSGPWVVYEVAGTELAEGLDVMPYVEEGIDATSEDWVATGLALWDPIGQQRFYAAPDGPDEWPHIESGDDLPYEPIEDPATVSDIVEGDDTFSFRVDEVGKPVLVKVSYFPNWKVRGADGPYRVTPNLMVVIPTDTEVELYYARTTSEQAGMALTALGIAGCVLWWRRDRRRAPASDHLMAKRTLAFAAAGLPGLLLLRSQRRRKAATLSSIEPMATDDDVTEATGGDPPDSRG